jgi:hypothetical protein
VPQVVTQAVLLWLFTRLALAAFTYVTLLMRDASVSPYGLLQAWQRWDANLYLRMVAQAYANPKDAGFLPLYPALVSALNQLTGGGHALAAALLVGNAGSLLALVAVALAVRQEIGDAGALHAVRILAAYPLAFFLAAPYSDGLFLACAALTLYFARSGRWSPAATAAFAAALTRPTALALVPFLAWEYAGQRRLRIGWPLRDRLARARWPELLAVVGAVPAGFAVFAIFSWWNFGDPLMYAHAQLGFWGHKLQAPWVTLPALSIRLVGTNPLTRLGAFQWIDIVPFLVFVGIAVLSARRLPASFSLYMAVLVAILFAAPNFDSADIFPSNGRYLMEAIPVFLVLGRLASTRPWLDFTLVSGGFLLQAVFASVYLASRWIG